MVELRWLKKEIERDIDCCNPEPLYGKFLQYRVREHEVNLDTGNIQACPWEVDWTEWQDVPTVLEGE